MGLFDWSTDANANTSIDSVNIAENCPPGGINNAIRAVMANVRSAFSSGLSGFLSGSAALPIASGGTGQTTPEAVRTAFGIGSMGQQNSNSVAITGGTISGLTTALAIASGGTGQTSAVAAINALGGLRLLEFINAPTGRIKIALPGYSDALVIQWGSSTASQDSSTAVTFPYTYTQWVKGGPFAVAKSGQVSNSQNVGLADGSLSLSGFSIWCADDNSYSAIPWIAIGV